MKGEILIVFWVLFIAIIATQYKFVRKEDVHGTEKVRYLPGFALLVFLPLILWVGFRSRSGYVDTGVYVEMFKSMPNTWDNLCIYLREIKKDQGFYFFVGIIKMIFGESYRPFLLIIAIIQGISITKFYRKYSSNFVISFFLFIITAEYFGWMMNGIRQFLAVSIIYFAIPWLIEKKYFKFIIVVLFAATIHQTALIMIPIAFIVQGKPWNKKTMIVIVFSLVALVATNQFTSILEMTLEGTVYGENMAQIDGQTGVNVLRVLVYSVPALLALVGKRQLDVVDDKVINISINMSIITMALYIVGMVTSGIMFGRLPIYTSLFNYILLPYEIDVIFNKPSAKIVKVCMVVFYLMYYYYLMHFAYGRI